MELETLFNHKQGGAFSLLRQVPVSELTSLIINLKGMSLYK